MWQVDAHPSFTVKQFIENNPKLLPGVKLRTQQDYLEKVRGLQRYHDIHNSGLPKVHHAQRLTFARVHKTWTTEQWKNVLWTQEAMFMLSCNTNKYGRVATHWNPTTICKQQEIQIVSWCGVPFHIMVLEH